jgi:Ni2+-binding GTPase involved in maturation of urease and hydrogenase
MAREDTTRRTHSVKFVIVAGTPGSGKTSVLLHTIKELQKKNLKVGVAKIDCLFTDDDKRFERAKIPIMVGIAADMCPDHFSIYNIDEVVSWAMKQGCDVVFLETAGLCLRCAPYTNECIAMCVVDTTNGPNVPRKIGPMLTTADMVVTTKGDMVSQAEREVFREKIMEINKLCEVFEANGLNSKGSSDIAYAIEVKRNDNTFTDMVLRHTPPLSICTLCTGELRVRQDVHCGVLRHMNGMEEYNGE